MRRTGSVNRTSFSIRSYRNSDRNACRKLWRQLAEKHAQIYSDPNIAKNGVEDYFDQHLKRVGPRRIWVAVLNAEVVGFVGLVTSADSEDDGEIEPLIVHRDHRGRGIGKGLTVFAAEAAKKLGVKYVTVRPVARNIEALGFFRNAGFDTVGRIELFMDLTGKEWKKGLELHGLKYEY